MARKKSSPHTPPSQPAAVIVGGGLAGLTLAAHLGAHNIPVLCLDRDPPPGVTHHDIRTTAISHGSHFVLKECGVWDDLEKRACPILDIRILDESSPVLLTFLSSEVGDNAFGYILNNYDLRMTLAKKLKEFPHVTHITEAHVSDIKTDATKATVTLKDKRVFSSPLLIGADGKNSRVREFMNVPGHGWSYDQTAFVCAITHENPHHNVAIEHFRGDGPFAALPMCDDEKGRHRSSIVWTVHGKKADIFKDCDDAVFTAAIAARMPPEYGAIALAGKRAAWPLSLKHAHRYVGHRCVLINEAAHAMHPIAGQGLNIGMRDIQTLSEMIASAYHAGHDTGADELLENYQRARKLDTMMMMAATDSLNKLFSNNLPFIGPLRRAGLKMIEHTPVAKQFFMRQAMGLGLRKSS